MNDPENAKISAFSEAQDTLKLARSRILITFEYVMYS